MASTILPDKIIELGQISFLLLGVSFCVKKDDEIVSVPERKFPAGFNE